MSGVISGPVYTLLTAARRVRPRRRRRTSVATAQGITSASWGRCSRAAIVRPLLRTALFSSLSGDAGLIGAELMMSPISFAYRKM